jgi:hypothetical protein
MTTKTKTKCKVLAVSEELKVDAQPNVMNTVVAE